MCNIDTRSEQTYHWQHCIGANFTCRILQCTLGWDHVHHVARDFVQKGGVPALEQLLKGDVVEVGQGLSPFMQHMLLALPSENGFAWWLHRHMV